MKDIFAHRGILNDILSAVSLPNSLKLRNLACEWEVDVVTSNPHYPKEPAENQTVTKEI